MCGGCLLDQRAAGGVQHSFVVVEMNAEIEVLIDVQRKGVAISEYIFTEKYSSSGSIRCYSHTSLFKSPTAAEAVCVRWGDFSELTHQHNIHRVDRRRHSIRSLFPPVRCVCPPFVSSNIRSFLFISFLFTFSTINTSRGSAIARECCF